MGGGEFRFKRFTVRQDGAAMKVGTDGVLLGAWCPVEGRTHRVLDIGTGTGLLALMIAQRCPECRIDAVEIDEGSFGQACGNFAASPWNDRITACRSSIQGFVKAAGRYDLVVSNPPYFENSLKSPDAGRTTARHTTDLTYVELVDCAAAVLDDDGMFAVIVPHAVTERFGEMAARAGLWIHMLTEVCPTPDAPPRRSLLAIRRTPPVGQVVPDRLVIEAAGRHGYSAEYVALTRDFYLKF